MKGINLFFTLSSLLFLCACAKQKPGEFVNKVNDKTSSFHSVRVFEDRGLELSMVFKPAEYNALMQINSEKNYKKEFQDALAEQEQSLRFDFRITGLQDGYDVIKDTLPPDLYLERIEYLSGAMTRAFSLVMDGDTLAPNFFHFERTYNMIPYNNFLLGFDIPRQKVEGPLQLIYHDALFGVGIVAFEFDQHTVKSPYPIDL